MFGTNSSAPTVLGASIPYPTQESVAAAIGKLSAELKRLVSLNIAHSRDTSNAVDTILEMTSQASLNLNEFFAAVVDLVGAYLTVLCTNYNLIPRQSTFYSRVNCVEVIIAYCRETWRQKLTKNSLWALANRRGQPGTHVSDITYAEVEETCLVVRNLLDFSSRLLGGDVEVFDELYVSTGALSSLGQLYKGRITKYNEHGRFGFIQVSHTGQPNSSHDVFFHENNVDRPDRPHLSVGRWVQFLEVPSQKRDRDVQFEARELKVCFDEDTLPVKSLNMLKLSATAPEFKTVPSPAPVVRPRPTDDSVFSSRTSHSSAQSGFSNHSDHSAAYDMSERSVASSNSSIAAALSNTLAKVPLFITCIHCREGQDFGPVSTCGHMGMCKTCATVEGVQCPICEVQVFFADQKQPSNGSAKPPAPTSWDPFRATVKVSGQ